MRIKILLIAIFTAFCGLSYAQSIYDREIPFSTDSTQLTIWNGENYVPFFLKGINLGISRPGRYPGELEATRAQYATWMTQIKEAGFNCIRLYTLHYPHFYEVLDSFNTANKHNPLFIFQGVWLNEEIENYNYNLFMMSDIFSLEIEDNINCVHGNNVIPHRYGKAYGTYKTDVSKWNMAYIIGREVYPQEVATTNALNPTFTEYHGDHLSIEGSAAEVWLVAHLDHLLSYEKAGYQTQRPVSVSSWPTLDPIHHAGEVNRDEDTAQINLAPMQLLDAPAGFFISYHAYPYYPDFVGADTTYIKYEDNYGPNSYLGYLIDLKHHYEKFPLIIAEYGVPSSWGVAHYTSSGMNHGGFDELSQGETNIRLLRTLKEANCGGGIQFAWIDEWFKRTWITDPIDNLNRILWHNVTAAEQNYGLVSFKKPENFKTWETFPDTSAITTIKADADYDFLKLKIGLKERLETTGEIWVAFDTYEENLGESLLPNGATLPYRSEFALHITNYDAVLYVTQAYDLFGLWHNTSEPEQLFQSTVSDGEPWKVVRWKNNSGTADVQYIGHLKVNRDFQPGSSQDAVTISSNQIDIRLPWSLINVVDPSQMIVLHDQKSTREREDSVSDGIAVSVSYNDYLYKTTSRFTWDKWTTVTDAQETIKTSYWVMKDRLPEFNSKAIAYIDSFSFDAPQYPVYVSAEEGLLKNDFDIDGDNMTALLIDVPQNGYIELNSDGSYNYTPDIGYVGDDNFSYCVYDNYNLSETVTVALNILASNINDTTDSSPSGLQLKAFPIPASDQITFESESVMGRIQLFDINGKQIYSTLANSKLQTIDVSSFSSGNYIATTEIEGKIIATKVVIMH